MDIKRLVLFFMFSFSILFLYEDWRREVLSLKAIQEEKEVQYSADKMSMIMDNLLPSEVVAPTDAPFLPSILPDGQSGFITIKTDLLDIQVNLMGGDIVSAKLNKIFAEFNEDAPYELLMVNDQRSYFVQSGLATINSKSYPNHKTLYHYEGSSLVKVLQDGHESITLELVAESDGLLVRKIYELTRGSYVIRLHHKVTNLSTRKIKPIFYYQIIRDNFTPAESSRFISSYTGPCYYNDTDHFSKVPFAEVDKSVVVKKDVSTGWVAFVQHYFIAGWIPDQNLQSLMYLDRSLSSLYRLGFKMYAPNLLEKDQTIEATASLYLGPQDQSMLYKVAPGFQYVTDYGMFSIISGPMFTALNFFNNLLGNWGWSIIILTFFIKLLFFPLSAASYKSMVKMKTVNPEIQRIKDLYADDKVKMQQEIMALFKKEGINPMAGCLPVLIQIPVFLALYNVLIASVEIRHAPWLGWVVDLSAQDPYYILPIILGITAFVQSRLSPASLDPVQAKITMIAPLVFSVMFFFFPAGLVLYWIVSNLLGIIQQLYITRWLVVIDEK